MAVNLFEWVETFFDTVGQRYREESEGMYLLRDSIEHGAKRRQTMAYSLPEFAKLIKDKSFNLTDFIYVRCTGSVIVNVYGTMMTHESVVSQIMTCIDDSLDSFEYDENGELFRTKHGFVLSSVRGYSQPTIYIGEDFVFTPEEKIVFKDFNFRRV